MFDFVSCATSDPVLFNIESKINPDVTNQTRSPADFVEAMGKVFVKQGEAVLDRITHQSFDVSTRFDLAGARRKEKKLIASSGARLFCPRRSILRSE